jgi:hypothetical protein
MVVMTIWKFATLILHNRVPSKYNFKPKSKIVNFWIFITRFCGDIRKYSGSFSITSCSNTIIIIFNSDWAIVDKGFKLLINLIN